MISNLTYRQKNKLLYLGIVLLLVLIYQLAIKKTLETKAQVVALQEEIKQGKNAQQEIAQMESQLELYNNLIGNSGNQTSSHEQILALIGGYCQNHNLTILSFPEVERISTKDFTLNSNSVEVKGTFKELTSLIFYLEKTKPMGKLVSVKYEKKKDRKTRKTILTANILIQNQAK